MVCKYITLENALSSNLNNKYLDSIGFLLRELKKNVRSEVVYIFN